MHIVTQNISKVFELSTSGKALSMAKIMLGMQSHTTNNPEKKVAVESVSLTIREGERVGIIGHNGAGKSTLLQMIAGLAEPTSGSIDVQGHVNCIMTLGVGLREELSGRENIYIDGELNGKQREETARLIEQIIAFADIGEFIDYPVRTYSSGMKARLAFAMIIFIEPEILIIDEALSAGDAKFVAKASAKMKEICNKGKILLLVSHSMQSIIDMCDRCIWMDHGRVVMDGPPDKVTEAYLEAVRTADELALKQKLKKRIGRDSFVCGFTIEGIELLDDDSNCRTILSVGENFRLRLKLNVTSPADVGDIRLHIERTDGVVIIDNLASSNGASIPALCAASTIEIPLGHLSLGKNTYEVTAELLGQMDNSGETPPILARCREIFRIDNAEYPYENPVCWHAAEWSFEEHGNY